MYLVDSMVYNRALVGDISTSPKQHIYSLIRYTVECCVWKRKPQKGVMKRKKYSNFLTLVYEIVVQKWCILCLCVCVCVRTYARACMCVCVPTYVSLSICMHISKKN